VGGNSDICEYLLIAPESADPKVPERAPTIRRAAG
jgi:hypothetical protein